MENEISLSFVNKGEPFILPKMTVKRQEKTFEMLAEYEKRDDMSEFQKNNMVNKRLLLDILQNVDSKVSIDDIDNMHPEDFIFIVNKVMSSGRELEVAPRKGFRKTK